MPKLQLYSIMPLDVTPINEICQDIQEQYEQGVSNFPLFIMTLTPEGTPPADKAAIYCEQYRRFREKLMEKEIPSGVLVQASIGHDWKLSEPSPYQKMIFLKDGSEREVVCPYDTDFQDYMFHALQKIASCAPDCIMIDDDLRLIGRGSDGCGCKLHMKRFNELANTSLTREQLHEILLSGSHPEYQEIYLKTQCEAVVAAAKAMRAGIDSIDPTIPGSFCCVGNNAEFAYEIASVLAGEGNPVVVRVNNANYTAGGARFISRSFQKAAAQIAKLKGKADILLAETDTCPQNRYSTGAMQLHSHFTGSILEGAAGAKHWITRTHAFEPASGKAYRKTLSKYAGFYQTLSELVPDLTWDGFRIPVCDHAIYNFQSGNEFDRSVDGTNASSTCLLERMGLPVFFSPKTEGVLCLEGAVFLSDREIQEALKKPVLLAADSAKELIRRGFGEYLGVEVCKWTGKIPSIEISDLNGNEMSVQQEICALIPQNDQVFALSWVYHTIDGVHTERLFPGVTKYHNSLGGTVFTCCGTPNTSYNIVDAFSFLNETRKRILTQILKDSDALPIYYPGDEEVYFRTAALPDGQRFVAVFNLSLDPIEHLILVCEKPVSDIRQLQPDGSWKSVSFTACENVCQLDVSCQTLCPVILILN